VEGAGTLTVGCFTGLADRLAVVLSGAALAEATGRRLTVWWPRTVHCGASFAELFQSPWPVAEVPEAEVRALPLFDMGDRRRQADLLGASEANVAVRAYGWMIDPKRYPAHQPLQQRCSELLDGLQPQPEILRRVQDFRATAFRGRMIGVHLRRADYLLFDARAAGGTSATLAAVDRLLARWPDAGVLLCTDDGGVDTFTGRNASPQGVAAAFLARFGERVVSTRPRSLNRSEPAAIRDALLDLLLLRATDAIVGTQGSSFSAMAAFGRAVPAVWCRSANPFLHLRPLWLLAGRKARWEAVRFYYGRLLRRWWN
jgi:hypothetical protein